jgi:hypothetical protein
VPDGGLKVEVRSGSPTGKMLSTMSFSSTSDAKSYNEVTAPVGASTGQHDLYFVFIRKEENDAASGGTLDWVRFGL